MNEELKIEVEEAEVVCGDCIGDMTLVEVQRPTPKLFTPTYYKRVCLFCTRCNKNGKIFLKKIEQKQ